MAKRRRLSAFGMVGDEAGAGSAAATPAPDPARVSVPPVARIAAEASAQAALDDLADELRQARESGRLILDLPLAAVEAGYLTRDRLHLDAEDMAALRASLTDRGQQMPIEVVALSGGRYGLISGARRLAALRALAAETGEARFSRVQAILRPATAAPEAYLAMVEENEIRSDLSFYERGRLAHEAAHLGVFPSPAAAVKALFVHAAPAKRSKILSFVALHEALGDSLRFPEAIPEKLGLALVKALQSREGFAAGLVARLAAAPADPGAERAVLEQALRPDPPPPGAAPEPADSPEVQDFGPLRLTARPGRAVLSGRGVTPDFLAELADWLRSRG